MNLIYSKYLIKFGLNGIFDRIINVHAWKKGVLKEHTEC